MSIYIDLASTKYTIETLREALKKRYKEEIHPEDIQGAFDDGKAANSTLGAVVKELVDLYVQTDGHSKNVILTEQEIAKKKETDNQLGIYRAISNLLHRPSGVKAEEIITATRMQVTLRKLNVDATEFSSDLVSVFTQEGLIFVKNGAWFALKKPRAQKSALQQLSNEEICNLFPKFENYVPKQHTSQPFRYQRRYEYSTEDQT